MSSPTLTEQQVIDGFHSFLQTALAQARAERLLDVETLASAEADLMVSGPALCLFFGALRASTNPPSVPLPRNRSDKSLEHVRLSQENAPAAFLPFVRVWAACVPQIQSLPSQHQHDLARIICDLQPLNKPVYSGVTGIAADLRAIALEISQRRTFQERYQSDLQAALDVGIGRGTRRGPSATAHFMPPPLYSEKDSSSTGSRTPEVPSPKPDALSFPEPQLPPRPAQPEPGPSRSSSLPPPDPSMTLIRETLFASLGDVFSRTPSLVVALKADPARAYFAAVALAILEVCLTAITPSGSIRGVLGQELTMEDCPPAFHPLMREIVAVSQEAKVYASEDDEDAMKLAAKGKRIPEPRMERVHKILESGIGYDSERPASEDGAEDAEGRRSIEGRAVQFSNRINRLALTMTNLPAFRSYAKDVFEILGALGGG